MQQRLRMKRLQWSMSGPSLCVLFAVACAADAKNPLAPDTFGGMNAAAIQYDCVQERQCQDDEDSKPPTNFVDTCVKMEASGFVSKPETEARFLNVFNRCMLFTTCGYRDCTCGTTASGALGCGLDLPLTPGYGESQVAQITYGCMQKAQCMADQGKPVADATLQVNNCVGATEGALFHFSTSDRSGFEAAFAMCSPLASCAFVGCYLY
jgi:hypothetical protein